MSRFLALFAPLLMFVGAISPFACASPRGDTTDDAGAPRDAGGDDVATLPDTPAARVAVRLLRCSGTESGCHGSGAAGMTLGDGPPHDFAQIVSVRSTERPDLYRVEPGAPDRSWLYLKVSNAHDAGVETAMPLGSDGDPAFAAELRGWIEAGAPTDLSR